MSGHEHRASDSHADPGFLAPPGETSDWRGVVLTASAVEAGLLAALPAEPSEAAARLGLSAHAVRIVLEALVEFEVVARDGKSFVLGPRAPDDAAAATLQHHARAIRGWSATLADQLAGTEPAHAGRERSAGERSRWLQALANTARQRAPDVADRCLQQFPEAGRVLDLAGGHGEYGLEFARRGLDVTLQDLPAVIDIVADWDRIRRSPVALCPLDAFEGLAPGPFDLVVCAGFTHTMGADANADLLSRLAEVIAPGGGVAIITFLHGHRPIASIFAVQMLVAGGGGDTHALDDYRRWLTAAGFDAPEVTDLEAGTSILTAARDVGEHRRAETAQNAAGR